MGRFKNKKQQAAVMASLRARGMTPRQARFVRRNPNKDTDGDGVKNIKDCKPFDPKKQGLLHDLTIWRLRKQEEVLEKKRKKAEKKLEDTKEVLQERRSVSEKKLKIKTAELKQKQAVIDEVNREKTKIQRIEQANREAKAELDKHTLTGKAKRLSGKIARSTYDKSKKSLSDARRAWNDPKNVKARREAGVAAGKTLGKIGKALAELGDDRPRRRRKRKSKGTTRKKRKR